MGLGNPRPGGESSHPGEPGIGPDLGPPFTAPDETTRWLFGLNRFGIRPGLQRIERLLAELGNPERELCTLVTAGTNGKGSTTRVLARLLQATGRRVGTYTSPHLLGVHERILVDDRPIDADDFRRRVEHLRPLVAESEASWFETLTALAVWIARDEGVEVLCCETGLGGRLDATNALPAIATLLTSVGLDHQRILGETREQILDEKLGLLKRGAPLFCAVEEDLRPRVFHAAVRSGSPVYFLDELADWSETNAAAGTWSLKLGDRLLTGLPDPGAPVLRKNSALALLALARLEEIRGERFLPDDPGAALGNLFLPGRYQIVAGAPDWIFDTAHNAQALEALLAAFTDTPRGDARRVLVFGAMYDKEIPVDLADRVRGFDLVMGVPVSLPRARTATELGALFASWGLEPSPLGDDDPGRSGAGSSPACRIAGSIDAALDWCAEHLEARDRVLVTGSCFTVAEVLYRLGFDDLEETRGTLPWPQVLERRAGRRAHPDPGAEESK